MILKQLEINHSSYYHRMQSVGYIKSENGGRPIPGYSLDINGVKVCDEQIKEMMIGLIETEAFGYGYYKLTICLRRRCNLIIDDKKVYRLCKDADLLRPQRQKIIRHPRIIARNREIHGSNQLWETDLKYGYIHGEDRFFYILSYLDVFDRSIIDYHMGLACESKDAVFTLESAMERRRVGRGQGLVVRSDNGPQFTSHIFEESCEKLGIEHERIPVKCPNKNAHIEAYHRILEDDCLSYSEFDNYVEAYKTIGEVVDFYNHIRLHSAIGYISPNEYYQGCLSGQIEPIVVKV